MAVISCWSKSWGEPTLSTHFQRPYVFPMVVCHKRRVPSSDPEAYSSPSGEKRTQCTGPKWPLKDSEINIYQLIE